METKNDIRRIRNCEAEPQAMRLGPLPVNHSDPPAKAGTAHAKSAVLRKLMRKISGDDKVSTECNPRSL